MLPEISQSDLQKLLSSGPRKAHLVGIAGSGMSGLARLLVQRGHQVSGSDLAAESEMEGLRELGVQRFQSHSAEYVVNADFVCFSSAISFDNPELLEAQQRGIPIVRRARALAALISPQRAVVISGTHGKTTTTSMIAHILREAGNQPSFFIGAFAPNLGSSAEVGLGENFVIEVDESDGTMDEFKPQNLVILNVEAEHLDFYAGLEDIERAFTSFARSVTGHVIYCSDDPVAKRIGAKLSKRVPYGLMDKAASTTGWRANQIRTQEESTHFEAWLAKEKMGEVILKIPGKHNVSNALAALAITKLLGIDFKIASNALQKFCGVKRRFEHLFESDEFLLVDDYAHHPSEVSATVIAAQQKKRKRLLVAFQPHRYTRTKALGQDFGPALKPADRIFVTDVYAASETPIEGVTGQLVSDAVSGRNKERVVYEPNLWHLKEKIGSEIQKGDLILMMGAGNISQVSHLLASELRVYHDLRKLLSPDTPLKRYEPMAKRTTLRTGGFAKLWIEPVNEEDMVRVLQYCDEKRKQAKGDPFQERLFKITLIGRGSNLLVRDAGISGVTIHLGSEFFTKVTVDGDYVLAGAGARLKTVVMTAKRSNLTGLEFLEGIPGSVGGALWMNAGAMGNNIFDVVEKVRFMDLQGNVHEKVPKELDVEYRACKGLRNHVILSVLLKAQHGEPAEIAARLKQFEKKRWSSQPAAPSAGCIFKNPPGTSAGKLLDELGLKGLSFGHARVSDVHANFIVNEGGATTGDVLSLISIIKDRVRQERGIELEPEVIMVGDERW